MSNIVVGTVVKFVGGKYNGFSGTVVECCDTVAAVEIQLGTSPLRSLRSLKIFAIFARW